MNIKVNYVWVDFDRKWLNKRYYCTVGMMKHVILRGKNRFYLYLQRKVFLSLALSMQFLYLCNLHPSLSLYSSLSLSLTALVIHLQGEMEEVAGGNPVSSLSSRWSLTSAPVRTPLLFGTRAVQRKPLSLVVRQKSSAGQVITCKEN